MRLLLAVDRRFIKLDGKVFTEGALGAETGHRYLSVFDEVVVYGRQSSNKQAYGKGVNEVTHPRVHYVLIPDDHLVGVQPSGRAMQKLRRTVGSVDAVIGRLPSRIGGAACRIAQRENIPWAVELGGCAWDGYWNHGTLKAKIFAPFAWLDTRTTVRKAKWVSYVTKEFLQRRYPSQAGARTVACSNVEIDEPSTVVLSRRVKRIERSSSSDPLVFGTIGSLHTAAKGIQYALQAIAVARDSLPPFEYRILGQGPSDRWQKQVDELGLSDQVKFCGSLPPGKPVFDWLDDIDVYLQPSLQEGLPRALIEAMSRGCPAIASTAGGIPELLASHCLHKPKNITQLARLLTVSVSPEWQQHNAIRNWSVSREYTQHVLIRRRNEFWNGFKRSTALRQH